MKLSEVKNLQDFLDSEEWNQYEGSWYCNRYVNESAETNQRIDDCAEYGGDGRKYCEVIELWREAVDCLIESEIEDKETGEWVDNPVYYQISQEIDDCEKWHKENGSYEQVIG